MNKENNIKGINISRLRFDLLAKTLCLCLVLICWPASFSTILAQEMKVKDFHLEESDKTAEDDATAEFDQNGDLCAVIKIFTKEKDFSYDVGSLGVTKSVDDKPGEIWLYVPFGVKKIKLFHQTFGSCEYPIDIAIESGKTYTMTLVTDGGNINEGNQEVVITVRPINATLTIDEREIQLNGGEYKARLDVGSHEYVVKCNGYITKQGSFNVVATAPTITTLTLTREGEDETVMDLKPRRDFVIPGTDVRFTMILVNGTRFSQGATPEQVNAQEDEKPAHFTTVSPYYIGQTEVTQELWETVMEDNPSKFKGKDLPVEQISWTNCVIFINRLNRILGQKFRIPTEAEWELAARGGKETSTNVYSGTQSIDNLGWYINNSEGTTHTVATKEPNELGIYDMSGNVREWCNDYYADYDIEPQTNPRGAGTGSHRVCRGGSWSSMPWNCRTSFRDINPPSNTDANTGLRLAM